MAAEPTAFSSLPEPLPSTIPLSADALARIQAIMRTNARLTRQSAALEARLHSLLTERSNLIERVATLEAELARQARSRPAEVDTTPMPGARQPARPLPMQDDTGGAAPAPRFPRPMAGDEELLLHSLPAAARNPHVDEPARAARLQRLGTGTLIAPPPRDYVLIASPFARFTDLGGFQAAVQTLPGVQDVRVRRFAQGTLEMRVSYFGDTPLADLLRRLAPPIHDVACGESGHLHVQLTPPK